MKDKKLNKIGNSLGVIIDKAVLKMLGIEDYVNLSIEKDKIVIKKSDKKEGK